MVCEPQYPDVETFFRSHSTKRIICAFTVREKSVEFTISNKAMNIVDEDGNRYIAGKHFRLFAGVSQPDTRSAELTGHKPVEIEIAL